MSDQKKICPETGKDCHDTRDEALEAAPKPGQRAFRCACGSWHLAVGRAIGTAVVDRV